jgi:tRNA(Ile)-lysidine synthase
VVKSQNKRTATHPKKARLTEFARQLLREWTRLELSQTRAVVALSGGADSVALLLGLDELTKAGKLRLDLLVAHLDHQLRKTSRADALWVKALAKRLGYSVINRSVNVSRRAVTNRDNLEQAARRARYAFLSGVAKEKRAQSF